MPFLSLGSPVPETAPVPAAPTAGPEAVIPSPALRPGDSALFSAPTMVLPAGGGYDDEDDEFEDVPEPPVPVASPPVPSAPVPVVPPPPPVSIEDDEIDSAFFGSDFGNEPAETLPVAPPPAAVDEDVADDDSEDDFAADFVDWGPDASLVMRRAPTGDSRVALQPLTADDDLRAPAAADIPVPPPAASDVPEVDEAPPAPADPTASADPKPDPNILGTLPMGGEGISQHTSAFSDDDAALLAMPTVEAPPPPLPPLAPVTSPQDFAPPPIATPPPITESFAIPKARPVAAGAEGWREAAATLVAAAARATAPAQAALYAEAARILATRAGDPEASAAHFRTAFATGVLDTDGLRDYAGVAAQNGDNALLREILDLLAAGMEGRERAEIYQDAALLERSHLSGTPGAVAALESSLDAVAEDPGATAWFSLRLLRDLHHRSENWADLVHVLGRMANLTEGAHCADLLVALGRVDETHLDNPEGAVQAYRSALEASPGNVPAAQALEALFRRTSQVAELAQLYTDRAGWADPSAAGFWLLRAARAWSEAGDVDAAATAWTAALDAAGPERPELQREYRCWLRSVGREGEGVSALRDELDATTDPQVQSVLLWRIGTALEGTDPDGALAAFQAAAVQDPAAGPAAAAAGRILESRGDHAGLMTLLEARLPQVDDPNLVVTTRLRLGELCEGPLDEPTAAVVHYEAILEIAPGYLPALEGLERVYARIEGWESLAALYEQRALLSEDARVCADYFARAGTMCELQMRDDDRARGFYLRALERVPDHEVSLDGAERVLSRAGDWAALATVLDAAAEATRDTSREVSLTYRAARIHADRSQDIDAARRSLSRCLDLSPGFLPALSLHRRLAFDQGDWATVLTLDRIQADSVEDAARSRWNLMSAIAAAGKAGVSAEDLLARLRAPEHAGPATDMILEDTLLDGGDIEGRQALLGRRRADAEPALAASLAVLEADLALLSGAPDRAVAALADVHETASAEAVAEISMAAGDWVTAREALSGPQYAGARARILEFREGRTEDAAKEWRTALEDAPLAAAEGLERTAALSGDREGLLAVHAGLAASSGSVAVAGAHALLAGHLSEASGAADAAEAHYRRSLASSPGRGKAFDALHRILVARADSAGIDELYDLLPGSTARQRGESLEEAGCHVEAAAQFRAALDAADESDLATRLGLLLRLERNLSSAEDWRAVFGVLTERAELLADDPDAVGQATARQRWVLSEHLAQTDEAWEFYQQLYRQDPQDVEVLEALARIAGARGETGLAVEYLEGLASTSTDSRASARFHRRIAEAHLAVDNKAEARTALHTALDLWPEDVDALRGLGALARENSDWNALVGVLAREANLLDGQDQVDRFREIATIWEEQIGDIAVAQDAWRKVLEHAPSDADALDRLLRISRDLEDWSAVVEFGTARAASLDGQERNQLLAEIGEVQLQRLYREDEALLLFDEASKGDAPVMEAARHFERIHAGRGAWDKAVEGVLRQARAAEGPERVRLLLSAAETRLETLHDREGASAIYAQVLEQDPVNASALEFSGDHLFSSGDLAGAVEVFARMEPAQGERDLDDFDEQIEVGLYYFSYAEALRKLDRIEEALGRYEKGLELNRAHLPSLEAVGPLYLQQERWEEARNVYRQILQLTGGQGDPLRLARTYTSLGHVELKLNNLDKAKKRFNKALELRSNDIPALQGIAGVLLVRKDWNNLLNVYNNIIYHAQEPGEVVDAYLTKGFVLDARMGLPDKAAQHYRKSLNFDPNQPKALLRLAELSLRQQDWPEANNLAEQGISLSFEDPTIRGGLHLVQYVAHAQAGNSPTAAAAYSRALELDPTLNDRLGPVAPGADTGHSVLKERLDAEL